MGELMDVIAKVTSTMGECAVGFDEEGDVALKHGGYSTYFLRSEKSSFPALIQALKQPTFVNGIIEALEKLVDRDITIKQSELDALKQKIAELEKRAK